MVQIKSVEFGEIVVNTKKHFSDVIVWWDGKVEYIGKTHIFTVDDMVGILKKKPKFLVVGTGMNGCLKIDPRAVELARQKGVEIYHELSPNLPRSPWSSLAFVALIAIILAPSIILAEIRQPLFTIS